MLPSGEEVVVRSSFLDASIFSVKWELKSSVKIEDREEVVEV